MPVLVVDIFGKEDVCIPIGFCLRFMALSLLLGYPFLGQYIYYISSRIWNY